jgi:mannose-6-phosphate isomerase-like protein (cupin superfamily)
MPDYTIQPFYTAPRVPFKFDGKILYASPGFELVHLTLQPGEAMEKHAQPFPVVFFVAEGSGTLVVGEETIEVTAKMTIRIEAGVKRAWANAGERPLVLVVNKLVKGSEQGKNEQ